MNQVQLKAEIMHLRKMFVNAKCAKCRRRLATRIEEREQHLRDHIKFRYLIKDLNKRGIAAKVVKRFADKT